MCESRPRARHLLGTCTGKRTNADEGEAEVHPKTDGDGLFIG